MINIFNKFFSKSKPVVSRSKEFEALLDKAYGPKGTPKRDEYDCLTSGKIPTTPLRFFIATYTTDQQQITISPNRLSELGE
jgi:hypothetical protein